MRSMRVNDENFLELYLKEISPQIQELDIVIKSIGIDEPLPMVDASTALCITIDELSEIMCRLGISEIDKPAFLRIMKEASSPICRMYQRELEVGLPYIYTPEDIAYIYELPLEDVNQTCERLGLIYITSYTLPDLFCNVHI
ncbi:MAG: hypothetical protein LBQ68_04675 [Clostridiales bacterium]|jgi:predicted transcriptional regulator|nr:hypothetical protein [Clostridiales bacterium]